MESYSSREDLDGRSKKELAEFVTCIYDSICEHLNEVDMNAAEMIKAELADRNKQIIDELIEPNRDKIIDALSRGIKRLGYAKIDYFHNSGTSEGYETGINDKQYFPAFAEWLRAEGFKVSRSWWGCSSDGNPDMLTITI